MANILSYGFWNLRDRAGLLVTEIGVSVVRNALVATLEQHNQELLDIFSLFVTRTTEFKRIYRTLASNRLQPLDENGRALPVKGVSQYEVAWPLQRAGTAWGIDYETDIKMTVQDANDRLEQMLSGDRNWMRDHVLAALYANTTWTFPDEEHGSLTIQGLANNDPVLYPRTGGRAAAVANHYLGQANAIADTDNPYPTIASTLKAYPGNSGQVYALIPTNLRADTEDLATFHSVADPNIRQSTSDELLVGSPAANAPGEYIGYVDGCFVFEWSSLPDSRIIGVMTGGERPLAMREDEFAPLRGFGPVGTREDFPFTETQYRRKAGFGAWNRVGALVFEIGDASYDVPTDYTSMMP